MPRIMFVLATMLSFMAFIMAFATQVGAEDISNDNYSTDNKLLSEVKTRMVLDNGLVVHIWEWNEKAKALGMDKHIPIGLIAQDVKVMYPEAVIEDENGYLMVDLPVLMDMDDYITKLVLEGGVARLVQGGGVGAS